jgi:adenylate kinase family enzyme
MLPGILDTDSWVLEGVYYRWLADAFNQADLIVILTPGTWTRQARMLRRFARGKLGIENG